MSKGFTLVEVLIVVILIAVLAAILVPLFNSPTEDAKQGVAAFNVRTLRSAIQIYKAQHNGLCPVHDPIANSLTVLLKKTTLDGAINTATGTLGPYLSEFPANPYTGATIVKVIPNDRAMGTDVTPGGAGGWLYNTTSGGIWLDSDPGFEQ